MFQTRLDGLTGVFTRLMGRVVEKGSTYIYIYTTPRDPGGYLLQFGTTGAEQTHTQSQSQSHRTETRVRLDPERAHGVFGIFVVLFESIGSRPYRPGWEVCRLRRFRAVRYLSGEDGAGLALD